MNKTKKNVGIISIILGIVIIIFFKMSGTYPITDSGMTQLGVAIGFSIYSKIIGALMVLAGIIAYTTRNSKSKTSAVVSGIILIFAVFITFNNYDPTDYTIFLILKIVNIVQAIRLFFSKPDKKNFE